MEWQQPVTGGNQRGITSARVLAMRVCHEGGEDAIEPWEMPEVERGARKKEHSQSVVCRWLHLISGRNADPLNLPDRFMLMLLELRPRHSWTSRLERQINVDRGGEIGGTGGNGRERSSKAGWKCMQVMAMMREGISTWPQPWPCYLTLYYVHKLTTDC